LKLQATDELNAKQNLRGILFAAPSSRTAQITSVMED